MSISKRPSRLSQTIRTLCAQDGQIEAKARC
jgi:hypothetical protein